MISVSLEDDAPPIVRAIAADLAAHLEDPGFAATTERVDGVASISDAHTPQAVTLRLRDGRIALAHGASADAQLRATVELGRRVVAEPELSGAEEQPELADWLSRLVSVPDQAWPQASAGFWSVLEAMDGAPAALVVVDLDTGEQRRLGAQGGPAYELWGAGDDLVAVLTGRVPLVDAAFEGAVFVRGSFPELSVLTGAGYAVRYGSEAANG